MTNMNEQTEITAFDVQGISAGYGDRVVLDDISFQVRTGSLVGLIGPNGAGKTTLLRVMSKSLPRRRGRLAVCGKDIRTFSRRALSREIAFVPQSLEAPAAFTVAEFAGMGRTPYVTGWARLSALDRSAVERAMEATDVSALAERTLGELSAGEKQRALLAMALAQEPRILLLDEPTAHLDIQHAWSLMEMIRTLNKSRKLTVVMSSHDLNLAADFCDELLLLEKGRLGGRGTPGEVLAEETLSRAYEYPLQVIDLKEHGRRFVVPRRREHT